MSAAESHGPASISTTLREVPAAVWALLVGTFINKLGSFLQVFLVLYLTNRGFSANQAGLALGAYGAGSIVGVIIGGSITDRFGYRRTIVASMSSAALFTIALLYAPNFIMIVAVVAITGAVAQAYRPASSALLTSLTPQSRHVMVFAAYRLAFNLGMTAGPLIGAFFAEKSFAFLLWADALTSLAFALIAMFVLPADTPSAQREQADHSQGGYLQVLVDKRYLLFLIALFLNAVVYIQYIATLPLYVSSLGLPPQMFGALVSLNALIVIVCELPITRFVQHFPMRLSIALGVGLVGLGLNLYVVPAGIIMLIIATIIWSLGEIIGTPAASAYPVRVAPVALRGRYLAASAAPQSLGYALGPVIGTFVWVQYGAAAWWLCGILTVLAVLAAMIGVTQEQPQASESPARV